MRLPVLPVLAAVFLAAASAQESPVRQPMRPADDQQRSGWPDAEAKDDGQYVLKSGARIPLTVLTTISSKNAAAGDQVYLQTIIPVAKDGRILIPAGSYVNGTITQAVRSGKVKGKGQLYLRFDSLMLPNGRTIDLIGKPGSLDGGNPGELNRDEGKITSDGSKGRDAAVVGSTAATGAMMGGWIGDRGRDAGLGAGAGAAAGLAGILLSRGPDAVLERGSTLDMVLNRDIILTDEDLAGAGSNFRAPAVTRGRSQGQSNSPAPMRAPRVGRGPLWP